MVALSLDSQDSLEQSTLHLPGEEVFLHHTKNGVLIVMSKPVINSRADLKAYVERAHSRQAGVREGAVLAAVTARRPITISRITELAKRYSFDIISAKMTLGNGNTVMSSFPPNEQWTSALQHINVNVEVCSLYIIINASSLKGLQSDHDIYLVDIGPVEIAEKYADGQETRVVCSDIFSYVTSDLPRSSAPKS